LIMKVAFKNSQEDIPMRKNIFVLAALLCVSAAVPTFAGMSDSQKDECVLSSRNCSNAVDDIQTQIRRIGREIDKGTAVYSPQELRRLEQKLSEITGMLHDMEKR